MGLTKYTRFISFLLVLSLLTGCRGSGWRHHNGFEIVRDYGERHAVVNDGSIVVGPRITHWNTYEQYLLVYKIAYNIDMKWADRTGYVIIDTSDGEMTFAATKKEYKNIAVAGLGIPQSEIVLDSIYPSIRDKK